MSYILAPNKEMLTPLLTIRLAYARTGFAYAHILSYAELTLAYAHHSFAYATALQGAPCLTWTQGFKTWLMWRLHLTFLDHDIPTVPPTIAIIAHHIQVPHWARWVSPPQATCGGIPSPAELAHQLVLPGDPTHPMGAGTTFRDCFNWINQSSWPHESWKMIIYDTYWHIIIKHETAKRRMRRYSLPVTSHQRFAVYTST